MLVPPLEPILKQGLLKIIPRRKKSMPCRRYKYIPAMQRLDPVHFPELRYRHRNYVIGAQAPATLCHISLSRWWRGVALLCREVCCLLLDPKRR